MKQVNQFIFGVVMILNQNALSQSNQLLMSEPMQEISNKKIIQCLYYDVLNQRHYQKLEEIVSKDYSNIKGETGIDGFKKNVVEFIQAFPDAKWTITEMIAEGNKVFVKQKVEGTHKDFFQNIPPTNQFITSEGMGFYVLEDGKIIMHQVQTNQLAFFQQLGLIPTTLSLIDSNAVYFVDRFIMPKSSFPRFFEKLEMNRRFIKNLEGFISDEVMLKEENGNIIVMTVAVWENNQALDKAKSLVKEEYQRIGFNPAEFFQRLNITKQRETFKSIEQ